MSTKKLSTEPKETFGSTLGNILCSNGFDGCGKKMAVKFIHSASQIIEAEGYNPAVHLCMDCSNRVAREWNVKFENLDFLFCAMQNAKAGKMEVEPTLAEVMEIYRELLVPVSMEECMEKVQDLLQGRLR